MTDGTPTSESLLDNRSVRAIFSTRYWRLVLFFTLTFLRLWILDYLFPRLLNLRFSRKSASERHRNLARQFRELATGMGGVMIKLGQFLSSRVDLMPPEVIEELSGLQDEVEPVQYENIAREIEKSLEKPPEKLFSNFEHEPVASASLGQVHLAGEVTDGDTSRCNQTRNTAVKVQRPNIRSVIETDLAAVRWLVGWLESFEFIRRRADLQAIYDQFSGTLRNELNYEKEAKNAEAFYEYTCNKRSVEAPRPNWELTTVNVLVLEQVEGIKITDYEELEEAGICLTEVAKHVQKTYLDQIFLHGFFHADPHPGNIFVRPDPKGPPVDEGKRFVLVFVDFGMVGKLSPETQTQLRQLLIAVISQDFVRIVELARELGFLLPDADDERLIEALRVLFERYYGITLGELREVDLDELEELFTEFRDLLFEFPFQVPRNFLLLGRCLGILNGLTTGLDPDFQPAKQIERFGANLIEKEAKIGMEDPPETLTQLIYLLLAQSSTRVKRYVNQFEPPIEVDVNRSEEHLNKLNALRKAIHRLTETLVGLSMIGGGFYFHPTRFEVAVVFWSLGGLVLLLSWIFRT